MTRTLDELVASVVDAGLCSGCGACTRLDDGLEMAIDGRGYLRPRRTAAGGGAAAGSATVGSATVGSAPVATPDAAATFRTVCPGWTVTAQRHSGVPYHPTLGPVLGAWRAAAADPEIRRRGSSGGVLTALAAWLVERGEVTQVVGARAGDEPRRTVPVVIRSRAEALASAGSRYAPVAVGSHPDALDPRGATIGKPCEAVALRALARTRGEPAPLLLSFFCAGTPAQTATDDLVTELGLEPGTPLDDLWYRGRGWPGRFTARAADGREVSASYDESWGGALGPTVQWRCKLCPDGTGESADVSAGDLWHADERGYPVFDDADGWSALVARTPRGLDVVERAITAGVLVATPVTAADVVAVQPLQRSRRRTLLGRLTGTRLAGARVPRYRGFGLLRLAGRNARENVRTARGTFRRVRSRSAARS
ncbi:Coenzyme F420 hydrogenase/dehydrogenase, beta subunit C-terminal domain [Cellulomonas alba]|uniref:Coenzyme F420 hydrogenase/dehydrogenase, beta subunit C-terminal domain n=1 Tax=Cellulomonas alba TaxID=3053467 RepID=A0ABT7SHB3_9CELL|nr:Coenzyme F420 hydrogenase/dehydrogenase, beta subunit C-terminal domain [Cellulomonas alba]MDM7855579.1 Coenzyme F420 hydrogenase/dehydrogenase, beta subunit C-terminal domain [Cellulomonas alba]